jgi:hypothetical protein
MPFVATLPVVVVEGAVCTGVGLSGVGTGGAASGKFEGAGTFTTGGGGGSTEAGLRLTTRFGGTVEAELSDEVLSLPQ